MQIRLDMLRARGYEVEVESDLVTVYGKAPTEYLGDLADAIQKREGLTNHQRDVILDAILNKLVWFDLESVCD